MSTPTQKQQTQVYRTIIDALQTLGHTSEWVEEQADELISVVVEHAEREEDMHR